MLRSRLMSVSEGKPISGMEPTSQTDKQISGDLVNRKTSLSLSQMANRKPSTAGLSNSQPRLSLPNTKGPSLVGLLASRRLAKQLSTRFMRQRYGSFCDSSKGSTVPKKEPTYRMEPTRKFDTIKVKECIKSVMNGRLQNFPYNPKFCANMSKALSDEIKGEVKLLNFDRYKIVCTVLIGQRKDQGTEVASRCAWNDKVDNFASYTFMNDDIFSTAVVYGIYTD